MTEPHEIQPIGATEVLDQPQIVSFKPWNVILLNDDHHSMPFVVAVVQKVIRCDLNHATRIMVEAHTHGRAILFTGCLEQAELKQEQVLSFREGPRGPVGCVLEQAV